jgi:hypothetical protein
MTHFSDAREAKEFVTSNIVAEAQRENAPLSEVERKMLYFSETGWTLPNIMEVNDEFERGYDTPTYEKKIARLITAATKRARKENPEEFTKWTDAIRKLNKKDHYITVMLDMADVPDVAGVSAGRVRASYSWKVIVFGVILVAVLVAGESFLGNYGLWPLRGGARYGREVVNEKLSHFIGYAWVCLAVLCLGGLVYSHFDRKRRLYKFFNRTVGGVFRLFGSRKRDPSGR